MDVTVVGSGPNGLSTAVICARAGLEVQVVEAQPTFGGGARSAADFDFPGVFHDVCSAVHPLARASPFFSEFDLRARGVTLAITEIAYANPLPGRPAAIAYGDLERTCAGLDDGVSWWRLLRPLVADADGVVDFMLGDKRSVPTSLGAAVHLGLRMLAQGTPAWGSLGGEDARALFTGVAAHAITPLPSLVSAGAGLMLTTLAHSVGWPIPVGGSQAITDALIADLRAHGGELTAGTELSEPVPGVAVFDSAPTALLRVYGDALPDRYAKALRRYRFRSAAAKVDFVLSDDIPWLDPRLKEAPTIHLGGTRAQMALAEADVAAGRHAQWPMVLAACPYIADPTRIDSEGRRPFWTYAHVPSGSTVEVTEAVTGVVERFAPGFRDIVLAARCVPAARMADHNANYVGGDIAVGAGSVWRGLAGPTPRLNPWRTPIPKVYLCSAATPPGPGVHGMCGYYAARSLLRREFGIKDMPKLKP